MTPRRRHTPAERNVEEIARLEQAEVRRRPLTDRISLAVTDSVGTFGFAIVHALLLAAWCGWNALAPERLRFDPCPFGLLTMIYARPHFGQVRHRAGHG